MPMKTAGPTSLWQTATFIPEWINRLWVSDTARKHLFTGTSATDASLMWPPIPAWINLRRQPARGLAIGDLDGNGRPEILLVNVNERPTLLKNTAPRRFHAVALTLTGTKSNRTRWEPGAPSRPVADVRSARSRVAAATTRKIHSPCTFASEPRRNSIALRSAGRAGSYGKRWRDLAVDRTLSVTEGAETVRTVGWKP